MTWLDVCVIRACRHSFCFLRKLIEIYSESLDDTVELLFATIYFFWGTILIYTWKSAQSIINNIAKEGNKLY